MAAAGDAIAAATARLVKITEDQAQTLGSPSGCDRSRPNNGPPCWPPSWRIRSNQEARRSGCTKIVPAEARSTPRWECPRAEALREHLPVGQAALPDVELEYFVDGSPFPACMAQLAVLTTQRTRALALVRLVDGAKLELALADWLEELDNGSSDESSPGRRPAGGVDAGAGGPDTRELRGLAGANSSLFVLSVTMRNRRRALPGAAGRGSRRPLVTVDGARRAKTFFDGPRPGLAGPAGYPPGTLPVGISRPGALAPAWSVRCGYRAPSPGERQAMGASGRRALIIGGGPGGLETAMALGRTGRRAEVFAQAPDLRDFGAEWGILRNATFDRDPVHRWSWRG